jgi:hypothetical protein
LSPDPSLLVSATAAATATTSSVAVSAVAATRSLPSSALCCCASVLLCEEKLAERVRERRDTHTHTKRVCPCACPAAACIPGSLGCKVAGRALPSLWAVAFMIGGRPAAVTINNRGNRAGMEPRRHP